MLAILIIPVMLAVSSLFGYALLKPLSISPTSKWLGGKAAGLLAACWAGWLAGSAHIANWKTSALAVLTAGAALGLLIIIKEKPSILPLLRSEIASLALFLLVLWIRAPQPNILGTEKFMDLGILATLTREASFPPSDFWLCGHTLPYYYFGMTPWALAASICHCSIGYLYNAAVAGLAVLCFATAAALLEGLALASSAEALGWALFACMAGTANGWIALLKGSGIDLWASSRSVANAITEFPLFSIWLGDLHPHLLSVPLILLAICVSGTRPTLYAAALSSLAAGAAWAANPWSMPPTLTAAAGLLVMSARSWKLKVALPPAVAGLAWVLFVPFHTSYHPPFLGLGLAKAATLPAELISWGAAVVALPLAAAWSVSRGKGKPELAAALGALFLLTVLGCMVGRPLGVLTLSASAVLGVSALTGTGKQNSSKGMRNALFLAALGLFLLAVPEFIYVKDPYGPLLHRQNTIFKSYFQAWFLLALATPTLLEAVGAQKGSRKRKLWVFSLLLLALPEPLWCLTRPISNQPWGLYGFRWMSEGDREVVEKLWGEDTGAAKDTCLVEATGDPYTAYGRISAATGIPSVLGWANHELVWRGAQVGPETERRARLIKKLYSSENCKDAANTLKELGNPLVVLGPLERTRYGERSMSLKNCGKVLIEGGREADEARRTWILKIE